MNEAFDELLDRAALAEEEGEAANADGVVRRRQFAVAVDRAVRKAQAKKDGPVWLTQTLKRFACRLHFFREGERLILVGCLPLTDDVTAEEA